MMDAERRYVIVYAQPVESPNTGLVLLTLKDRPAAQKGRLNLPGGKIEPGESPVACAVRELKEEAGLDQICDYDPMVALEPEVMGEIRGEGWVVHCVKVCTTVRQQVCPREGETETTGWHDWYRVKNDRRLMPNLQAIIPLMKAGVKGWVIEDNDESFVESKSHSIKITFNR